MYIISNFFSAFEFVDAPNDYYKVRKICTNSAIKTINNRINTEISVTHDYCIGRVFECERHFDHSAREKKTHFFLSASLEAQISCNRNIE